MIIFKKMPFPRPKRWNLAEKWWTSYRVQSVDPFPIEKLHQFERIGILAKKKTSTETKIFKKYHVAGRNDASLPKKRWFYEGVLPVDLFLIEKFDLLAWNWIVAIKKNDQRNDNFHKNPFRWPKRWNLAEKRWTPYGVLSINPFPIENLHQFVRTWILAQKKKAEPRIRNFQKNAISMAETTKFGGKTMNLLWSLGRWPISTWKASQIFANLNSGAKRKRALKWQF